MLIIINFINLLKIDFNNDIYFEYYYRRYLNNLFRKKKKALYLLYI